MMVKLREIHLLLQYYFMIINLPKENEYSNLKKIWPTLLKSTKPDGLQKIIDRYKVVSMRKPIYLLCNLIHQGFC